MKNYIFPIVIVGLIVAMFVGMIYLQARSGNEAQQKDASILQVGQSAIPFNLKSRDGGEFKLDALKGKNVVLFFNEGIMCYPACWNQVAAFGNDPRFNSSDTIALSVVADRVSDWDYAIQKMPELGRATLLFDTNKEVSMKYGMLTMSSSMHYGSLPGHTYVIIDKAGVVRDVIDDPNMAINNDSIFKKVQSLNN